MYISKEEKEDYERRFNGYIMRIIKNEYIRYSKSKAKERRVSSLNEISCDGIECIQNLIGEKDIYIEEVFAPEELELIFEDASIYRAVKSLTRKEKLAIFLCFILEMDKSEVAEILGYSSGQSVYITCERAISKIRNKIKGGKCDDWFSNYSKS